MDEPVEMTIEQFEAALSTLCSKWSDGWRYTWIDQNHGTTEDILAPFTSMPNPTIKIIPGETKCHSHLNT